MEEVVEEEMEEVVGEEMEEVVVEEMVEEGEGGGGGKGGDGGGGGEGGGDGGGPSSMTQKGLIVSLSSLQDVIYQKNKKVKLKYCRRLMQFAISQLQIVLLRNGCN